VYDVTNCLNSADGVELVAMADLFQDRIDNCLQRITENAGEKVKVSKDRCFVGFDAYKELVSCDLDLVMLTETPHFRPVHLQAAIEAGKHVFMEKPVAVDPVGVRSVIQTSALADSKGRTIVAGTQMRRIAHLVELMRRIHNGDIGDIVAGHCVRTEGGMLDWGQQPQANWSDMELQIRRWLFYVWLGGDLIVEQQIHNLDLMNWALGSHPVKCLGMGGRAARTDPEYGNDQWLRGTKGTAYFDFANAVIEGANPFRYKEPVPNPCITQHADQIAAIREGKHLNEGRRVAESTLTAIMGRMSAYTGRALSWDWVMNASQLDYSLGEYEFGYLPVAPVAAPGRTQLI